MPDQLFLLQEVYHPTEQDIPCLIHYLPKAGGSHYTITMAVDLCLRGKKMVIFTAYASAKENFLEQLKEYTVDIAFISDISDLQEEAQVYIVESGDEQLFMEVLNILDDVEDRIVLVKNIEVFGSALVRMSLSLNSVILSGNVESCDTKKEIVSKEYQSIVCFSHLEEYSHMQYPELRQYEGYLWSKRGVNGVVCVKK